MKAALEIAAKAAGIVAILALVFLVFGLPVGPSLSSVWQGAFGSWPGVARSLVKATPLILIGLGLVLAWRAAMYNIGGEGQYVMGALGGAAAYRLAEGWPSWAATLLILVAGCLAGGAYAFLAGWLQVRRGVQVVISTILLNFVALSLLGWLVSGPLQEKAKRLPLTDTVDRSVRLWQPDRQVDLHLGVAIALLLAVALAVWMFLTKSGFMLRLTGENPRAARANRMPVDRIQMLAMAGSGGFCGLAGAVQYLGVVGQVGAGFAEGWGFMAIPVALLGGLHPLGALLAGIGFGGLLAGCDNLSFGNQLGNTLVYVVQGVAVLAFVGISAWRRSQAPPEAEDA